MCDADEIAEDAERNIHDIDAEIAALQETAAMLESDGVMSAIMEANIRDSVLISCNSRRSKT